MNEIDYERDVKIDEQALDTEWLEQAPLARRYAKHLADCKNQVRQLEEKKKTIRSELINEVNKDPKMVLGKDKPNAADIEAYYRTHSDYKEVTEELNEAQYELDYAELAYQQIAWTRKKTLENLVILHGQQYFAGPSTPRDISKEWEQHEKQKQSDKKVQVRRKK